MWLVYLLKWQIVIPLGAKPWLPFQQVQLCGKHMASKLGQNFGIRQSAFCCSSHSQGRGKVGFEAEASPPPGNQTEQEVSSCSLDRLCILGPGSLTCYLDVLAVIGLPWVPFVNQTSFQVRSPGHLARMMNHTVLL